MYIKAFTCGFLNETTRPGYEFRHIVPCYSHKMIDYTGKLQLSLSLEQYKKDICYIIGILYPEPLQLARCYETE